MPGKEIKTVSFIGSGNVACALGYRFRLAGFTIRGCHNPHRKHAASFIQLTGSQWLSFEQIIQEQNLLIVAIPDDALPAVCEKIKTTALVLHTSGPTHINLLQHAAKGYGVLYPFQSITVHSAKYSNEVIPFYIEGNNISTQRKIYKIAKQLSDQVYRLNSEKRLHLHLTAVISQNFSNHLLHIAELLLKKEKLKFSALLPLLSSYCNKLKHHKPSTLQTGPAIRGDKKIMAKHLALLKEHKEWEKIYRMLSRDIIRIK
jgi:predicted short-subunit dehydrogenase-like oxidoreductase (DUF2520 family)